MTNAVFAFALDSEHGYCALYRLIF
jgi:hypothetical protein